jgi:hypothetical protein
VGGCAFRATVTSTSLQRCGDTSLPDLQSTVRSAFAANDWICGKPSQACRTGLVCPRLQHPMSSPESIVGSHPLQRFDRTSTGIKAEGEGEWNARKPPLRYCCAIPCRATGGPKRRLWRKIHIGIDEETQGIRTIEVTSSSIGDAPMLPDLLNQIPPDQELGSVTADGAYDTRKCHDAIAARNAHAVIPPRKNAKLWKPDTPGARARNEAVRSSKYLGRAL